MRRHRERGPGGRAWPVPLRRRIAALAAALAMIAGAWMIARSPGLCAAWLRFDGLPAAWCAPLAQGIPGLAALDLACDAALAVWVMRMWSQRRRD